MSLYQLRGQSPFGVLSWICWLLFRLWWRVMFRKNENKNRTSIKDVIHNSNSQKACYSLSIIIFSAAVFIPVLSGPALSLLLGVTLFLSTSHCLVNDQKVFLYFLEFWGIYVIVRVSYCAYGGQNGHQWIKKKNFTCFRFVRLQQVLSTFREGESRWNNFVLGFTAEGQLGAELSSMLINRDLWKRENTSSWKPKSSLSKKSSEFSRTSNLDPCSRTMWSTCAVWLDAMKTNFRKLAQLEAACSSTSICILFPLNHSKNKSLCFLVPFALHRKIRQTNKKNSNCCRAFCSWGTSKRNCICWIRREKATTTIQCCSQKAKNEECSQHKIGARKIRKKILPTAEQQN